MIPTVTTDLFHRMLSVLPGVVVLLCAIVGGELAISYALARIKWNQEYRWPVALAVGAIAFLFVWGALPAVGLHHTHLALLGGIVLLGLLGARFQLSLIYPVEKWIYERGSQWVPSPDWVDPAYRDKCRERGGLDMLTQQFIRPVLVALELYALLVGLAATLQATILLEALPPTLRSLLSMVPPPSSPLLIAAGIGGGATAGVLFANYRRQDAFSHMDHPTRHGDLISAGRVAAPESSMARPDEPLDPPLAGYMGYALVSLPDDAPKNTDDVMLSSKDHDDSNYPRLHNAEPGKALVTKHGVVIGGVIFEYATQTASEVETDGQTETVRFTYGTLRDDCLSGRYGIRLVENVMWSLDADRYITTVDNPFDYQGLYDIGFAYSGKTTADGVKLERPGPALDNGVSYIDLANAEFLMDGRGDPKAFTDLAQTDRSPERYQAGLQSFLENSDLATTLSTDARTFINEHLERKPPTQQSYWEKKQYKQNNDVDLLGSGSTDDSEPKLERTSEPIEASSASSADGFMDDSAGPRTSGEHPLANRYTDEQLAQGHYDWQYSDVTFADIGGYDEVKSAIIDELIEPLRAAAEGDDRFERFGIEPERGILFYGPPGTGKTMFARALAGQLGVPFVELSPADVTSKWINEGPQLVNRLFAEADRLGPCVIFLDEAEHLFGARDTAGRATHTEDRKITSEFLVHLTDEDRDAIVVSATNRPGDIDPAILRPGRLTTHYEVGLPDKVARQAILSIHLGDAPSALTVDDRAALAAHTRGFSGADLDDLVDQAKRAAAKRDATAVTLEDFPSLDELEDMVADLEAADDVDALPDPDADSTRADLDAGEDTEGHDDRGTTDGDDRPVGFQ